MIIIGERINSSIDDVRTAIENKDAEYIKRLAVEQYEAGAHYIDVNAGIFLDDEVEKMRWMVENVNEAVPIPVSIDSPNSLAVEEGLKASKGEKPIINSISGESERFERLFPLIRDYKPKTIVLCMDDEGIPESAEGRLKIAKEMVDKLKSAGLSEEDIFIDCMVKPIATGPEEGQAVLETIKLLRNEMPNVNIVGGVSNISYGLPARKYINHSFVTMAMANGLNSAILNPCDSSLTALIKAGDAVLGKDEYCLEYLQFYRGE